jgi:hypothetical protein
MPPHPQAEQSSIVAVVVVAAPVAVTPIRAVAIAISVIGPISVVSIVRTPVAAIIPVTPVAAAIIGLLDNTVAALRYRLNCSDIAANGSGLNTGRDKADPER